MAVRRFITDLDIELDLGGVERRSLTDGLDPTPWAAHEVLVVTADEDRLAEAGRRGLHRLVPTSVEATTAAALELCRELDRPVNSG